MRYRSFGNIQNKQEKTFIEMKIKSSSSLKSFVFTFCFDTFRLHIHSIWSHRKSLNWCDKCIRIPNKDVDDDDNGHVNVSKHNIRKIVWAQVFSHSFIGLITWKKEIFGCGCDGILRACMCFSVRARSRVLKYCCLLEICVDRMQISHRTVMTCFVAYLMNANL